MSTSGRKAHAKRATLVRKDRCGDPLVFDYLRSLKVPPAGDWGGWDIADDDGWTAAHWAATNDFLPEDFTQWDLSDKEGYTVREAMESAAKLREQEQARREKVKVQARLHSTFAILKGASSHLERI